MDAVQSPLHVAVIMDGNRRWAASHSKEVIEGHLHGASSAMNFLKFCLKKQITYVSLFAFSKENWSRSPHEIDGIWKLIEIKFNEAKDFLLNEKIKFIPIGDKKNWPVSTQILLTDLEVATQHFNRLTLIVALSYSGKWDIEQAVERAHKEGNSLDWQKFLMTGLFPDPDILIRTGFEKRISNFYLYNLAYTELFFPKVFWPDFNEEHFTSILEDYYRRDRRFGAGIKRGLLEGVV
jgi:undecaprenyl diphosphate synthase